MRCNTKIQILQRGITEKEAVGVNDDVHQREEKNAYEKILSLKSIHKLQYSITCYIIFGII